MIVIPAVDIKDGRCVRLKQGRMSEETVYSDDPVQMAGTWYSKGAERIHLVDLDGAVGGKRVNGEVIRKIARSVPVPVELGGGIRNLASIEFYLEAGVQWVILGTAACKDPKMVEEACRRFPGHVMLAIDARAGRVAVEGWTEDTERSAIDVARPFDGQGIAAVIYTDIQRDGMSVGPNLRATGETGKGSENACDCFRGDLRTGRHPKGHDPVRPGGYGSDHGTGALRGDPGPWGSDPDEQRKRNFFLTFLWIFLYWQFNLRRIIFDHTPR